MDMYVNHAMDRSIHTLSVLFTIKGLMTEGYVRVFKGNTKVINITNKNCCYIDVLPIQTDTLVNVDD